MPKDSRIYADLLHNSVESPADFPEPLTTRDHLHLVYRIERKYLEVGYPCPADFNAS